MKTTGKITDELKKAATCVKVTLYTHAARDEVRSLNAGPRRAAHVLLNNNNNRDSVDEYRVSEYRGMLSLGNS